MTHLSSLGNHRPVPPLLLQCGADTDIDGFSHGASLVKNSCLVKEQITKGMGHPQQVTEKSINEVVAINLQHRMRSLKLTQSALAEKANVSQKTISNYLNPAQRTEGSKGKQPSAKLSELAAVAKALDCEVWELTRDLNERERAMYEAIEKAYRELVGIPVTRKNSPTSVTNQLAHTVERDTQPPVRSALARASLESLEAEIEQRSAHRRATRQKGRGGY